MVTTDRKLVVFSVITSILSATLGFIDRFVETLEEIDIRIIFFSGIFILLVIVILLFFLIREVIIKITLRRDDLRKNKGK
ncbi:MAG: hypothetical protein PVJ67_05730 [Candidatus Pacearchaeota archaeon]|jgi:hypothetical protein